MVFRFVTVLAVVFLVAAIVATCSEQGEATGPIVILPSGGN